MEPETAVKATVIIAGIMLLIAGFFIPMIIGFPMMIVGACLLGWGIRPKRKAPKGA